MKWKTIVCAATLVMFGAAASASAAAIVGTFNFTNSVTVTGVDGPDANVINDQYTMDFFPAGGGVGTENTTSPATGYFTPLFPGSTLLNNLDITDSSTAAGFTFIPTNTAVSVPNFLSNFSAMPGLSFELNQIALGGAPICTGAEAVNVVCSPSALSPFTLQRTATGVAVQFGVSGLFHNGADIGAGTGSYTTQLVGATIGGILTTLAGGGHIDASFSANFVSQAVPEPATLLTFGLGSGLLALRRRRQQRLQA